MKITHVDADFKEDKCRSLYADGNYEEAEEIANDLLDYGFRQTALALMAEIAEARELVDTDAELESEMMWDRHLELHGA